MDTQISKALSLHAQRCPRIYPGRYIEPWMSCTSLTKVQHLPPCLQQCCPLRQDQVTSHKGKATSVGVMVPRSQKYSGAAQSPAPSFYLTSCTPISSLLPCAYWRLLHHSLIKDRSVWHIMRSAATTAASAASAAATVSTGHHSSSQISALHIGGDWSHFNAFQAASRSNMVFTYGSKRSLYNVRELRNQAIRHVLLPVAIIQASDLLHVTMRSARRKLSLWQRRGLDLCAFPAVLGVCLPHISRLQDISYNCGYYQLVKSHWVDLGHTPAALDVVRHAQPSWYRAYCASGLGEGLFCLETSAWGCCGVAAWQGHM